MLNQALKKRLSGISAALFLLAFILFGSSLIERIPIAVLVGVMIVVSIATFEWTSFRIAKSIPKVDLFIILLVSVTTIFVDLAVAVVAGVIVASLEFCLGKKANDLILHSIWKVNRKYMLLTVHYSSGQLPA